MTQPLSLGRIVLMCIGFEIERPVLRPAICVRVWSETCGNFQVFTDGSNDDRCPLTSPGGPSVILLTSCVAAADPEKPGLQQWVWPARVGS